ncbi:DUF2061 domain-containing protein [Winogradskyella sp. PE311]|uniref:DUF2061 domain-containing protein n=1 Tax=Winogradskyella sp. PE311 TaxID=3366943 RepID=UPI0039810ECC
MNSIIQTNLDLKKETDTSNSTQDNIKRSIVKTISWRVVGTLATVVISYLITGTLALAFSIGGIELVSKMVLYFFHERAWNNIKWGK